MTIDLTRTVVRIYTQATGALSFAAHDLALEIHPHDASESGGVYRLRFDMNDMIVLGVMRHGTLDTTVLSERDKADIAQRMVAACGSSVEISAEPRDQTMSLKWMTPRATLSIPCVVRIGSDSAEGSCEVSLSALNIGPIRGPLGAFRVADRVRIEFRAALISHP